MRVYLHFSILLTGSCVSKQIMFVYICQLNLSSVVQYRNSFQNIGRTDFWDSASGEYPPSEISSYKGTTGKTPPTLHIWQLNNTSWKYYTQYSWRVTSSDMNRQVTTGFVKISDMLVCPHSMFFEHDRIYVSARNRKKSAHQLWGISPRHEIRGQR